MTELRINPQFSPVWSTTDKLRFGVDRPMVTLDAPSTAVLRLLHALSFGVAEERLPSLCRSFGIDSSERHRVIEQLAPVLERVSTPRSSHLVVVGDAFAALVQRRLEDFGYRTRWVERVDLSLQLDPEQTVLLVSSFVSASAASRILVQLGVPHLGAVLSEQQIRVSSPLNDAHVCASALERRLQVDDPQWSNMAAQLMYRSSPLAIGRWAPVVAQAVHTVLQRSVRADAQPEVLVVDTSDKSEPPVFRTQQVRAELEAACECALALSA